MGGKSSFRKEILKQRNSLSTEAIQSESLEICQHIIDSPYYQQARKVFIFVSMGTEVDTTAVILHGFACGKIVAVPKVNPVEKEMIFSRIQSLNDLETGHFGVLEPPMIREEESDENTIFIVPGLLFDLEKNRIGYGGGYYDRYLGKASKPLATVGVAYEFQVIPHLPTEPYDVKMDWIVTKKGWK